MLVNVVKAIVYNNFDPLFIQFLKERDLLDQFVVNFKQALENDDDSKRFVSTLKDRKRDYIIGSFSWDQDGHYGLNKWSKIHNEWVKYLLDHS